MHFSIILIAVGLASLLRLCWSKSEGTWGDRWQHTLGAFLLPPLLLGVTSLTILGMGHKGTMLGLPVGEMSCLIALGFLGTATGLVAYSGWQGWRSLQQVRACPLIAVAGSRVRLLNTPALFAAQVGFWQPELVLSQGLLQTLEAEQIQAVLSHEQAHRQYRDTFWFFWLGWVRHLTCWLPQTAQLWQELLLLRELRADHWAAQRVDALVLAESLLTFGRSPITDLKIANLKTDCAAFNDAVSLSNLEERIEFLLNQPGLEQQTASWVVWTWVLLPLLPLLALPFHA